MSQAHLTLEELRKVLSVTSPEALKRFVRGVLGAKYVDDSIVPLEDAILVLLEDWMAHLGVFTDAQRGEIVRQVRTHVKDCAFAYSLAMEHSPNEMPLFRLVISDWRWVSCDGRQKFFDLEEMEEVLELPKEAITHVTCDVTALFLWAMARVNRVRKMASAGRIHESVAGNSGETRQAGDAVAGGDSGS